MFDTVNKTIDMLNRQQAEHKTGSLEYLVAELLKDMARKSPAAADLLARDLELEKMDVKAAGQVLYNHAKENKSGNSYGMCDEDARKLLAEFYHIPQDAPGAQAAKAAPAPLNLMDFL